VREFLANKNTVLGSARISSIHVCSRIDRAVAHTLRCTQLYRTPDRTSQREVCACTHTRITDVGSTLCTQLYVSMYHELYCQYLGTRTAVCIYINNEMYIVACTCKFSGTRVLLREVFLECSTKFTNFLYELLVLSHRYLKQKKLKYVASLRRRCVI
jgi:hypothetical protein